MLSNELVQALLGGVEQVGAPKGDEVILGEPQRGGQVVLFGKTGNVGMPERVTAEAALFDEQEVGQYMVGDSA